MKNYLLTDVSLPPIRGIGPLGLEKASPATAGTMLTNVISKIIGVLTVFGAFYFLFRILLSGYTWISAGADKNRVEDAQKTFINSVLGLTIVIASIFILSLIGKIMGIPNILDLENFINTFSP